MRRFTAAERAKAGITGIKEAAWQKIEDANALMDMEAVSRYYRMIAKDEGITTAEAMDLCITMPKYSLGLKMASPAVVMMLRSAQGKKTFESWLTPEEKAEWDKVKDLNFRQLIKKEKKKQKRE